MVEECGAHYTHVHVGASGQDKCQNRADLQSVPVFLSISRERVSELHKKHQETNNTAEHFLFSLIETDWTSVLTIRLLNVL